MTKTRTIGIAVALSGLLAAAPAAADNRPDLVNEYGISASVGGGLMTFTDEDMRDFTTDVGGYWDARLVVGTRTRFAVEAAYTGSAQEIDALGLDSDAMLIGSGLEAAARFNILTGDYQPYLIAGAGWKRYDVVDSSTRFSSVSGADNLIEVPLGGGISYRYRGFVVDARAVLRPAFEEDLIDQTASGVKADLHQFSANVNLGFEF